MLNPIKWLLTKETPSTKEANVTDITASDTATTDTATTTSPQVTAAPITPVAEVKAGVKDFEAAFTFVEQGIAQLGVAAKDELKTLAQKYL